MKQLNLNKIEKNKTNESRQKKKEYNLNQRKNRKILQRRKRYKTKQTDYSLQKLTEQMKNA
jgi:hypothetical protein